MLLMLYVLQDIRKILLAIQQDTIDRIKQQNIMKTKKITVEVKTISDGEPIQLKVHEVKRKQKEKRVINVKYN